MPKHFKSKSLRNCFLNLLYYYNTQHILLMAISKQYLKTKPVCKVTFSLLAEDAKKVGLAGSFNKWKAVPLKKLKNGTFKGTVDLDVDSSYEFKYIVDGNYVNDDAADSYVWNDFAAADNSVVTV